MFCFFFCSGGALGLCEISFPEFGSNWNYSWYLCFEVFFCQDCSVLISFQSIHFSSLPEGLFTFSSFDECLKIGIDFPVTICIPGLACPFGP